ncbi:MAG TPA: glutamyl-tRNA reductase [Actinomycetes bacterium]|nr:glutamyl-tRNA reductase [Actinomycetes bacterium]
MPVFVVGLSFTSAPLELLERLAIDPERRSKALAHLTRMDHVHEGVVLSTCNRVEVYAAVTRFHAGAAGTRRFLAEFSHVDPQDLAGRLYDYYQEAAVAHLFRVAAGLDSMVVGEVEVLGQVREALAVAEREGAAGPVLGRAFQHAIRAGRRVRAETALGTGPRSTVSVGLALARGQLGGLAGRRVVVVGAGAMGRLAGRTLRDEGAGELMIVNRSPERGAALARELDGRVVPLDRITEALAGADLLVACTAATSPTVSVDAVAQALPLRAGSGPLVVLDLGVPRDVEPAARALPGVVLADLDDVRTVLEASGGAAGIEIERARALVDEAVASFMTRQREARLAPTIRALRGRAEALRRQELDRARPRLAGLDPRQAEAVEALTRGLVNKLLHDPVVRGKQLATGPDGDLVERLLRDLFGLDGPPAGQPGADR